MRSFIFILLSISITYSKEINISSKGAIFDGENLNITGKILLSHPLGKLQADKGYIKKVKNKKNFFDLIYLNDNVTLELTNGKITSKKAVIDKETKKIKFFKDVKYIKKDLNIKSNKAECFSEDLKNFKISFLNNVFFNYKKILQVKAGKIIFIKDEITFSPPSKKTLSFNHQHIKAQAILAKFLPKENSLFLKKSKGIFYYKNKKINFSADNIYSNKEKTILENNSILEYNPHKILSSKIEIFHKNKILEKIIAYDNSQLLSFNYTIKSKTPIIFDIIKNNISSEGDIYFTKEDINIYAQKALIKTEMIKNKLELKKIILEKNVSFKKEKNKHNITIALSDKLKFNTSDDSLKLESYKNNKVLFWQSKNDFSLSAKKIKMFFKENEKIQGYGNVRFSLNPLEKTILEKNFKNFLNDE